MGAGSQYIALVLQLERARTMQGRSLRDVAREIGVTHGALSQWIAALTMPTTPNLFAWAAALGVQIAAIIPTGEEC